MQLCPLLFLGNHTENKDKRQQTRIKNPTQTKQKTQTHHHQQNKQTKRQQSNRMLLCDHTLCGKCSHHLRLMGLIKRKPHSWSVHQETDDPNPRPSTAWRAQTLMELCTNHGAISCCALDSSAAGRGKEQTPKWLVGDTRRGTSLSDVHLDMGALTPSLLIAATCRAAFPVSATTCSSQRQFTPDPTPVFIPVIFH